MEKQLSLLEKAKRSSVSNKSKKVTQEEIDLALAWVNDEITKSQITDVIPKSKNNYGVYVFLSNILKAYIKTLKNE